MLAQFAVFAALQVADVITTLIGFRYGAVEAIPFTRWLVGLGPVAGLVLVKLVSVALALAFMALRPAKFWKVNAYFAVLAVWNVGVIAYQLAH